MLIDLSDEDYRNGIRSLVFKANKYADRRTCRTTNPDPMHRNICAVCGHAWAVTEAVPVPKRCPACKSSKWNDMSIRINTCKCCAHTWVSRVEEPKRCPACRSRLWNRDVKRYECPDCGYTAMVRQGAKVLSTCSNCGSGRWRCVDDPPEPETKLKAKKTCCKDPGFTPERIDEIRKALSMPRSGAVSYLLNCGFESLDAEVMVRCMNGDSEILVANDLDVSVGKVLQISGRMRRAGLRD